MNEIKCSNCVKFKTQFCPCTIDCMATDDYPYFQDRRMILEENANLKQALNEIREYCNNPFNWKYTDHYLEKEDILQIIDKFLGGNGENK